MIGFRKRKPVHQPLLAHEEIALMKYGPGWRDMSNVTVGLDRWDEIRQRWVPAWVRYNLMALRRLTAPTGYEQAYRAGYRDALDRAIKVIEE